MNEQYALELIRSVAENQNKTFLWLENAQLTSLPSLPNHIRTLQVSKCKNITEIPELPPNLKSFCCNGTPLKTLPSLPRSLDILNCAGTEIEYLPELPSSLGLLNVYNSKVATLPALPESLGQLCCGQTSITEFPPLPRGLRAFDCSETRITKLPALPANLEHLEISKTPLCELPDHFPESLETLYAFEMLIPEYDIEEETPNEYVARVKKFQRFIVGMKLELNRKRIIARCKAIKEELMAATWHPDRVLDWCDPNAFDCDD
jgi:hypothetical protein